MITIILYFVDGLCIVLLNKPLLCNSLFHGDIYAAFMLMLLDFVLEILLAVLVNVIYMTKGEPDEEG